ncbi:MAG TPA: hypothetical protein HPP66_04180 [Planctomycetes bacterium]|nr:hypothetical protein [Planctomycetota bacterium]
MISNLLILAEGAGRTMFSGSNAVILVVYAFFVGLIIIAAIVFIRFLSSGMKEMKLMRMEVGKLAEELRLLRKELKDRERSDS